MVGGSLSLQELRTDISQYFDYQVFWSNMPKTAEDDSTWRSQKTQNENGENWFEKRSE